MKRVKHLPDNGVLITLQTARKAYGCDAEPSPSGCTGKYSGGIKPGETYARATITPRHDASSGHWWRQAFCLRCAEWWGWLDALPVDERWELRA